MKVVILSDTHICKGKTLPGLVWEELTDADMILHAGDVVSDSILQDIALLAPLVAVKGNCDWFISDLPDKAIVDCENIKVGLIHGFEGEGKNALERAYNSFINENVDIIVFGHSHMPYKAYYNGVLMFNPGSPTERRGQKDFSLGIMNVNDDYFDIEHLFF